jgi:hypothetical protein
MSTPNEVASIRIRRESLLQAVIGLEDALASPLGDKEKWRLRVAMATHHASARIEEHVTQTEGAGHILEEIRSVAPRLDRRVEQMLVDHETLQKAAHDLQTAVATLEVVDDEEAADQAIVVRNKAVEMMGLIARHRQRGADLVYEAYHVDLGNSA